MSIESLNSDLLIYLLDFLPNKELFKIESVNKKWQKCVRKLMNRRITEFGSNHLFRNAFKPLDKVINDNNIDVIKNILSRCQHVKYLNFKDFRIRSSKNGNLLLEIAKLCPELQRINLKYSSIYLNDNEWEEFCSLIGPKLIRCNILLNNESEQNFNFLKILFKHLKMIEKLEFNTWDYDLYHELFANLNSCENLKMLTWNYEFATEAQMITDQMINVIQRLNCLKTDYNQFIKLNCKMDNLTKLKLSYDIDGSWSEDQMNEIEYPNLKTFFVDYLVTGQLKLISKLKFPNLSFAHIRYYNENVNQFNMDQQIFLRLFKNVNQLYVSYFSLAFTEQFNSFTNLTKLTCDCFYILKENQLKLFDMMKNHKSLEDITINEILFNNYEIAFMESIFDGIIKLSQSKPNAKIFISILMIRHKDEECEHFVNDYIRKFVLNNWHASFQKYLELKVTMRQYNALYLKK